MSRLVTTLGVMLAASAMAMPAQAGGGRIGFSGAIVESTCRPELGPNWAAPQHVQAHCPDTSAATRYTLRVEPAAALQDSQLIAYFESYLRMNGSSGWLATQQYD